MGTLIPSGEERQLLGRFYGATFLAEVAHLAMPFQVLLIVRYLGQPQLGILLGIEQLVALTMELPSGAWADRFGRKRCVLAGHVLSAAGWLLIPSATLLDEHLRLAGMGAAFGLLGAGTALVSGALEAWVVDNLRFKGRQDLAIRYFGRERSLAASGGIAADLLALVALSALWDIRLFWVVTGAGELIALAILWRTPEHSPTGAGLDAPVAQAAPAMEFGAHEDEEDEDAHELEEHVSIRDAVTRGFTAIWQRPALLACTLALVWLAASFGTSHEAFQAALAELDLAERGFAGLELGVDTLGMFAPLLAIILARHFGSRPLLALGITMSAGLALVIWRQPGALGVASAYLLVVACGDILHTIADDYQHQLLPSAVRATASSAINLVTSIAMLVSTGWLTLLLAKWSAAETVAIMGLSTLPAALFLIPKFSRTEACPQIDKALT